MSDPLADLSAKWRGESAASWLPDHTYESCADDLDSLRAAHTLVRTAELWGMLGTIDGMLDAKISGTNAGLTRLRETLTDALAPFEHKEEVK